MEFRVLRAMEKLKKKAAPKAPEDHAEKDARAAENAAASDKAYDAAEMESLRREEERTRKLVTVWPDGAVCLAMGTRRRVIVAARTAETRGKNWGCAGTHAGMTLDWVESMNPAAATRLMSVAPAGSSDGIVTVMVVRKNLNRQVVEVERLCDGKHETARIRDAEEVRIGMQMDAVRESGMLIIKDSLNREAY